MPSLICTLVNSSQNSFWDITLCDPKGNRVIQAVRYYYHSLVWKTMDNGQVILFLLDL